MKQNAGSFSPTLHSSVVLQWNWRHMILPANHLGKTRIHSRQNTKTFSIYHMARKPVSIICTLSSIERTKSYHWYCQLWVLSYCIYSLCNNYKDHIMKFSLKWHVECYPMHSLVGRVSGKICKDDSNLQQVVQKWKDNDLCLFHLINIDLTIGLTKPKIWSLLSTRLFMIFLKHWKNKDMVQPVQVILFGDPKWLLYDWSTYDIDKATFKYMKQPEAFWKEFHEGRCWGP